MGSSDPGRPGSSRGSAGREEAEDRLRAWIVRGELGPGQRLVEAELAAELGVARNSARLAIDALIGEGLVERVHHRGARVRRVATAEAVEILECRLVLEGLIARRAAERGTAEERDGLRTHLDQMRRAVAGGDLVGYSTLIADLHERLRAAARHATASALVGRLQAQVVRDQFQLSLRPGRPQRSLAELEAVVAAVVGHDPDRAEQAARDHLASVIDALTEVAAETVPA